MPAVFYHILDLGIHLSFPTPILSLALVAVVEEKLFGFFCSGTLCISGSE